MPHCGAIGRATASLVALPDQPDAERYVPVMADYARVVVACGHMVDAPDRPRPRFPPDQVPRVAYEIDSTLSAWRVGPDSTLITGGARGADLLAAQAAWRRGAQIRLYIPSSLDEFEKVSVRLPGTDWAARFNALRASAQIEVVGPSEDDRSPFERVNNRIAEAALALDLRPHVLVVWDGQAGDGPGGTRDFVDRVVHSGLFGRLRIIDPRRPDQRRRYTTG
jgi:hypothetical protein